MQVATQAEGSIMAKKAPPKKKRGQALMGRPRTEKTTVSSPTVPRAVEFVHRVVDPLEVMHRAGQITERQWHVIERYRAAWEMVYGQAGGSMDFDRVRGLGVPGSPPLPGYLYAAEVLRIAREKLYPLDHKILTLVLIGDADQRPMTFKQVAGTLGYTTAIADHRDVGRRFKIALDELADLMFGPEREGTGNKIRSYLPAESRPVVTDEEVVTRGNVVHATGRKVFRS